MPRTSARKVPSRLVAVLLELRGGGFAGSVSLPSLTLQARRLLPSSQAKTRSPSGLKATELTRLVCPEREARVSSGHVNLQKGLLVPRHSGFTDLDVNVSVRVTE